MLADLNDRVGNEVIEGKLDSTECQEDVEVTNIFWRCVQSMLVVGNSIFRKNHAYTVNTLSPWMRMVEGRVGG